MKRKILSIIAALSFTTIGVTAQSFTVDYYVAFVGSGRVIISMEDAAEIADLQMTLSLPEGFTLNEESIDYGIVQGSTTNDHVLSVKPLASGDYLITLYSLGRGIISDGTLLSFPLTIADGASDGEMRLHTIRTSSVDAVSQMCNNVVVPLTEWPVNLIYVKPETVTLVVGDTLTLISGVRPQSATNQERTWSSSDKNIATVDNNGLVTAIAEGVVDIVVEAGGLSDTCVVTVEKKVIAVSGITLSLAKATLTEGESLTLTATVAPDNATDKAVTWSSSNAAVATVDNNGVVTAVAEGSATITAKAGDKEATCVVTVEKKAEEIVYAEIANGDYYLKNVGSGKFLTGANDWGTQASLGEYGLSITLERLPNGKYTLDTHVANNQTDHYLGSNGYIDASVAEWIITEPKSGTYALTLDGTSYWGYDGSGTVLANALTDPTQKNAQWQLVTRAELENALSKAALNNGVDATFYIQGHSFSRNHNENAAWMGEPVLGGPVHDMNAEKFNTTPLDIYQELSGVPNGYYVVEVQGFYRDNVDPNVTAERRAAGGEQLRASLYAGVYSVPLKSILDGATAEQLNGGIQTSYGWVPNSMDETASYFAQGLYINKVDAWVTDGTLRIGIRKETGEEGDWVIFDNFRLTYYGTKAPAGIGQLTIDNGQLTIDNL